MTYLKYLATSLHCITDNAKIAPEHKLHMLDLFDDVNISQLNVSREGCTGRTDCSEIANAVTHFISENHSNTVICLKMALQLVVKSGPAVKP